MPCSSNGLGRRPLKPEMGVRLPYRAPRPRRLRAGCRSFKPEERVRVPPGLPIFSRERRLRMKRGEEGKRIVRP